MGGLVADRGGAVDVCVVIDLCGGECGDVGSADGEPDAVGTVEPDPQLPGLRSVFRAVNRTTVQFTPAFLIGSVMPISSLYARGRPVRPMKLTSLVCGVGFSLGSRTLGVPRGPVAGDPCRFIASRMCLVPSTRAVQWLRGQCPRPRGMMPPRPRRRSG